MRTSLKRVRILRVARAALVFALVAAGPALAQKEDKDDGPRYSRSGAYIA